MRTRWMTMMVAVLILVSLTACAESLHQTQRLEMMASGGGYGAGDDDLYDGTSYGNWGYWGYPFGYYSGFYGPGYGYGYPYYYGYYGGRSSGPSGPSVRPTPPANAPRQFLKRK